MKCSPLPRARPIRGFTIQPHFSSIQGRATLLLTRMQMSTPFSQRCIAELHAKAAELLSMSETARTADTRDALRRLADRFVRLAESRGADQARCSDAGGWTSLQQNDTAANL